MFTQLVEIVKEYVEIDERKITNDTNLIMDLGIDSFTLSEIACAIEDEFEIEVPETEMHRLKSVGDVISFIQARVN